MTEIEDEEFEPGQCHGHPVQARKFSMFWLGSMLFNFFANVWRSATQFCEEATAAFYAHGLYRHEIKFKRDTTETFKNSVMADINAL